jgi:hypothetical protein
MKCIRGIVAYEYLIDSLCPQITIYKWLAASLRTKDVLLRLTFSLFQLS